ERLVARAKLRDHLQAQRKLTEVVDGQTRIREQPPILTRLDGADAEGVERLVGGLLTTLQNDRRLLLTRYPVVDAARQGVGIGSVGVRSFLVLLRGWGADDPLFLQVKEAGPSVLEGVLESDRSRRHGQRVVEGQRLMQAASDAFLGWTDDLAGRAY